MVQRRGWRDRKKREEREGKKAGRRGKKERARGREKGGRMKEGRISEEKNDLGDTYSILNMGTQCFHIHVYLILTILPFQMRKLMLRGVVSLPNIPRMK